jgi:alpha-tubulin suppressor-like RCC1 family protein
MVQIGQKTYCALMSTGTVRCVGYGGEGQMGNGTTTATNSTWKLVEIGVGQGLSNITNIYCTGYHGGTSFYALTTSKELYAWGYNSQGQLALGNTTITTRATKISTVSVNSNVEAVYPFNSGYGSIIIKTVNGDWYGSGYNGVGQLGLGDTTNRSSFTLITSLQNKKY